MFHILPFTCLKVIDMVKNIKWKLKLFFCRSFRVNENAAWISFGGTDQLKLEALLHSDLQYILFTTIIAHGYLLSW